MVCYNCFYSTVAYLQQFLRFLFDIIYIRLTEPKNLFFLKSFFKLIYHHHKIVVVSLITSIPIKYIFNFTLLILINIFLNINNLSTNINYLTYKNHY